MQTSFARWSFSITKRHWRSCAKSSGLGRTYKRKARYGERGRDTAILAHPGRWALPPADKAGLAAFMVSILAHPGRWALLQISHTPSRFHPRFNPRPPRKVGATQRHGVRADQAGVSILAHPGRWALHHADRSALAPGRVSILAHPGRWALHGVAQLDALGGAVSILAHPGRWALQSGTGLLLPRLGCFNPRPPRKVGATRVFHSS